MDKEFKGSTAEGRSFKDKKMAELESLDVI